MTDSTDKRRAARFLRREAIHIQIVSAGAAGEGPAQVVHCRTVDVSATGFKVVTDAPIDAGRVLDLLIEVDESRKRYLLVAETRWCRPEEGAWAAGFELLDAENSDFAPWQALFA